MIHLILLCLKINICTQLGFTNIPALLRREAASRVLKDERLWIFSVLWMFKMIRYAFIQEGKQGGTKSFSHLSLDFGSARPRWRCPASASEITS